MTSSLIRRLPPHLAGEQVNQAEYQGSSTPMPTGASGTSAPGCWDLQENKVQEVTGPDPSSALAAHNSHLHLLVHTRCACLCVRKQVYICMPRMCACPRLAV